MHIAFYLDFVFLHIYLHICFASNSSALHSIAVQYQTKLFLFQGTEIYDAKKGAFVDIGILDVMQIFGRAGRPQFDKWGHGYIITKHDKLSHYLALLTRQTPIESQFNLRMTDNLNAEVSSIFFGLRGTGEELKSSFY